MEWFANFLILTGTVMLGFARAWSEPTTATGPRPRRPLPADPFVNPGFDARYDAAQPKRRGLVEQEFIATGEWMTKQ